MRPGQRLPKVVNYVSQLHSTDFLLFRVEYYGKPFGTAHESHAFYVLDPLVLLTTVWL